MLVSFALTLLHILSSAVVRTAFSVSNNYLGFIRYTLRARASPGRRVAYAIRPSALALNLTSAQFYYADYRSGQQDALAAMGCPVLFASLMQLDLMTSRREPFESPQPLSCTCAVALVRRHSAPPCGAQGGGAGAGQGHADGGRAAGNRASGTLRQGAVGPPGGGAPPLPLI